MLFWKRSRKPSKPARASNSEALEPSPSASATRVGRNPRTGETVHVEGKSVPFFKAGKELRARLNDGVDPEDR